MTKEDRIAQVVNAIDDMEVMDAVDIIAESLNSCKKRDLYMLPFAIIGRILEEMHGRSMLIRIEDDGHLSVSIAANGVEQKLF